MSSGLRSWWRGCAGGARIMRRSWLQWAAASLACSAVCASAAGALYPSDDGLTPLAGLHEEVVLQGVMLDDRRLDLNRFVDHRPPHVLREEVRSLWSHRPAPVHALERDGWLVLVQAVGAAVETMEMRALGAGTEGRHARLSRPDPDLVAAAAWLEEALPAGCRVLRRLTHRDGDRRLTTVVAVSNSAVASLSQRLLAGLQRHGFSQPLHATPSLASSTGSLQFLVRGDEELALAIGEGIGERSIVLHWGRSGR